MTIIDEATAINGQAIWSGTAGSNAAVPTDGHVTYTFSVTSAGTYKVWGRFLVGPSTSSDDSLWVRVDSGSWTQWNDIYPRIGNADYGWDSEHDTPNANAEVTYSLGTGGHTLEVAYRENGLKMDMFLVTNNLSYTPPLYKFFEAEAGSGASTAPMTILSDVNASGGQCIWSGTANSTGAVPADGHVTFSFSVTSAGTYTVWGHFLVGPSTSSDDSLWVRIDTGSWTQWNDLYPRIGNSGYGWDSVHDTPNGNAEVTYSLAAGSHTLEVAYRENGLKMDRFLLSNDTTFTP
jgi:hypothetical protein